jgi:hypothetical protein
MCVAGDQSSLAFGRSPAFVVQQQRRPCFSLPHWREFWSGAPVTIGTLALRARASVMWAAGYDVRLETLFFEYFDQKDKPGIWPKWLIKPWSMSNPMELQRSADKIQETKPA